MSTSPVALNPANDTPAPPSSPGRKTPTVLGTPRIFKNYEEARAEFNRLFCFVIGINAVVRLSDCEVFAPNPFKTTQYVNWLYEVDGKNQQVARKWFNDSRRNQCERMTYAPGKTQFESGALNRWKGLASTPQKGDVTPWNELLDFLFPNAPEARRYFEQWIAYPLQHPGTKLKTAAVLYSRKQGIGKNILVEAVEKIYGANSCEIGERQLCGSFNSWLRDRQFIVGDEVQGGNDKRKTAEHLKRLITSQFVEINEKFKPEYTLPNVANFVFLTNNPDPFYVADEDRRFWVWEIPQREPLPDQFYKQFGHWKESPEGIAALHWHLLHGIDTRDFDPDAKAPSTDAKNEMIELGRTELERWLRSLPDDAKRTLFTSADLLKFWRSASENSQAGESAIQRALKSCGYQRAHGGKQIKIQGKQLRLWIVASPDEAERLQSITEPSELAAIYEAQPSFAGTPLL